MHRPVPARAWVWLVGILVPLGIVLGVGVALRQPTTLHGHAKAFHQELRRAQPEVVILGSSLAHRGVDLPTLARELDVPVDKIVNLHLPHAAAAHWYAVLKNRVFAEGHRPRLVLVAGALTTMLNHDQLTYDANVERLVEQLSDDEPVLAKRVFGFDDGQAFTTWFMRERASSWRSEFLRGWQDRVVAYGFTRKGRLKDGRQLAERVNDMVFDNAQMDYALHRDAPTGLIEHRREAETATEAFQLRRDGLIDVMQELADAHDARLVYVRMPFPPSNLTMDEVPPDIEADALAWMDDVGSGYLDMRTLRLSDADFEDMRHLTRRGAVMFTGALGRALRAMADADGAVVRGLELAEAPARTGMPELPSVTGSGCERQVDAGALAALGGPEAKRWPYGVPDPVHVVAGGQTLRRGLVEGCSGTWDVLDDTLVVHPPAADVSVDVQWSPAVQGAAAGGDVAWLWPGSTLTFHVADPWTMPAKLFQVAARALALGAGGHAEIALGEGSRTLDGPGRRWHAVGPMPVPDDAWTLSITVSEDSAPVLVHHLAVGVPPTTAALLGTPETLHGASVRFVGGRLDDTRSDASYTSVPAMDPFVPTLKRGPRKLAQAPLPKLKDLADSASRDQSGRPNQCSPVRVLEDGVPLDEPHAPCSEVADLRHGRACHAGGAIYFAASDDSDPLKNGRTYELALAPDRQCATWTQKGAATLRGSWWLYPGDEVRLVVPPKRMRAFRDGPNVLDLETIPHVADADVPLEVSLWAEGVERLATTWLPKPGTRRQRHIRLALSEPLPPDVEDVVLRLRNPSDTVFHLISMASLVEAMEEVPLPVPEEAAVAVRAEAPSSLRLADIARVGTGVPLPTPKTRPGLEQGAFEARLHAAYPVSNSALDKLGLGAWSPVTLTADGEPLQMVHTQKVFRAGCEACFMHTGASVVVRAPANEAAQLVAGLAPEVPMVASEGVEVWWSYPDTTLQLSLEEALRPGDTVVLRVLAMHPRADQLGHGLALEAEGRAVPVQEVGGAGLFAAELTVDGLTTALAIRNADTRGFALVRDLVVRRGEGTHAVLPRAND